MIDMLCLNLPNGGIAHIYNKDIFKVLSEYSTSSSSSVAKAFKQTVREAIKVGHAVSVETGQLTGFEERKRAVWFGGEKEGLRMVEEKYVTHWTPLKDQDGRVKWVVLTLRRRTRFGFCWGKSSANFWSDLFGLSLGMERVGCDGCTTTMMPGKVTRR